MVSIATRTSNGAERRIGLSDIRAAGGELKRNFQEKTGKYRRKFYDIVFLIGFLCCLVPGPLPALVLPASLLLVACFTISYFDENFYIYTGLLIYVRYLMLIGDTPVYRLYSYLMFIKFVTTIFKTKFRIFQLPAIFVFFLHCIFVAPKFNATRLGLNVIVDCVIVYMIISKIISDQNIMRKFIYAFMLGGITSGVYGWTCDEVVKEINVAGSAQKVSRNFGSLNDANFAGLYYSLCVVCSIVVKKVPKLLRVGFIGIFMVMLMQTVSLSAMLTLAVLLAFWIVLKFRGKSVFILFFAFFAAIIGITLLMTIPQFKEIEAIADLIIRLREKLSYISRGRWDLLTTDRVKIWETMIPFYMKQSIWMKIFGGNADTVHFWDEANNLTACHNSYIQSLLNFGIIGTILVYLPFLGSFVYKLYKHFSQPPKYEDEDVRMICCIFAFSFLVFGMSVDFFIDWPFMILFFV